ncbi:hypothetical protein [Acinetobacter sp. SFD]|uniref:hypothetical protein n=1 Tax=Acinetobacter sp. SFD TaxID=1805635 RepID=UPI0007D099D3|nr:hypothetical protein [Acinetobacter sp. SFD]OAL85188.1 hypothetical protein AY605_04870 [Acinetobacter sp. SFD]
MNMKIVILLSVLAVSLTGCVVDPHDDYRGHKDRDKHHDRPHGDRDWNNNKDRPDWNNNKDRPNWNNPGQNNRNPPPPSPTR